MNERIQNILDQAINAMPEHLDFDIPKELAEKFAELIAAECINMIEAEAKNADEDDVHGMRNAAGLIGRAFITFK